MTVAKREFTNTLQAEFQSHIPFLKDVIERGADEFGPEWELELERMLECVFANTERIALAAKGYGMFVIDLLRRQRRFEIEGRYPDKSYEDAAAEVYHDDGFMTSQYLPGLLLSHYLWPHHYRQLDFFRASFARSLSISGGQNFTEIGVGTGIYSRVLLETVPNVAGRGIDISESSRHFAEEHVRSYGLASRYGTEIRDVIENPLDPVDWLICVEVLEHLEDPTALLSALRSSLRPGGKAFITTALNAANVDHIYLYRSTDEVLAQLLATGFSLEQSFHAAAHPPTSPGAVVPSVAAFVVT